jgi:hypothetical protein
MKSHARMPHAWAFRSCRHVGDARRGAGPSPAAARIRRIAPSLARYPRSASSPWMRRYPQRGFSRASCPTRARTSFPSPPAPGNRPGSERTQGNTRQLSPERQATHGPRRPCPWPVRPRGPRPWPSAQSRQPPAPLPPHGRRPQFVCGPRNAASQQTPTLARGSAAGGPGESGFQKGRSPPEAASARSLPHCWAALLPSLVLAGADQRQFCGPDRPGRPRPPAPRPSRARRARSSGLASVNASCSGFAGGRPGRRRR